MFCDGLSQIVGFEGWDAGTKPNKFTGQKYEASLSKAVTRNDTDSVKTIVDSYEHNVFIGLYRNKQTILHLAAEYNHTSVLYILIEKFFTEKIISKLETFRITKMDSLLFSDNEHNTIMHYLAYHDNAFIAEIIFDNCTPKEQLKLIEAQNYYKETPISVAQDYGSLDFLELMQENFQRKTLRKLAQPIKTGPRMIRQTKYRDLSEIF